MAPEDPLTVLHLCSLTRRNGTVHLLSRLCRALAGAGHRVLLGAREGSKALEWTADADVEHVEGLHLRRGLRPLRLLGDARGIREVVRAEGVQVVHAWQSIDAWLGASAVLGTGARFVRSRTIMKPLRRNPVRALLRRPDAVFATCTRIEERLREYGVPADSIVRLDEGVDVERFRPDAEARARVRRELRLEPHQIAIANVGRLEPVKGQKHFLRALAGLPRQTVAVVVGEGGERARLEDEVRRLGLDERVRLLGKRRDVEAVLAASDVYVLSSIGSEGSSRATLEALATGLPVLCADVGMLPDIVRENETGYLFPPGDERALRDLLARVVDDRHLRARLGRAARAWAVDNRSEEAMLESVLRVYRRVLAGAAR